MNKFQILKCKNNRYTITKNGIKLAQDDYRKSEILPATLDVGLSDCDSVELYLLSPSKKADLIATGAMFKELFAHHSVLSSREIDIVEYISRGLSNKDIAYELGISYQTVKNHMANVTRKLRVDNKTEAVIYAIKNGWIK